MPAVDQFAQHSLGLESPVSNAVVVTPDNDNDLSFVTRGIMVSVSGDVAVTTKAGNDVTLPALAAGIIHPFRVSRIKSTGTTATGILAVW